MDDDFMSKVFDQNIEATQLLLNIILERTDIRVISVIAQREFKTTIGHSVRFDVFAEDQNGKPYDIEIQRTDKGAVPQRARYNSAVLDSHLLKLGEDYTDLPESYVIFITENDVLNQGLSIYKIERTVNQTSVLFGDGSHIMFVNGQYNGDDSIGKLMHDFRCKNAEEMNYSVLANKVKYFKTDEGGSNAMCRMMEDMRNETAYAAKKDNALKMLKDNLPVEKVAEYSGLSLEEIEQIKKENNL